MAKLTIRYKDGKVVKMPFNSPSILDKITSDRRCIIDHEYLIKEANALVHELVNIISK